MQVMGMTSGARAAADRFAGLGLVLAASLAVGCDSDRAPTVPAFVISDGAHPGGNPDFFFLPPLVRNPDQHPNFDAGAFDVGVEPSVLICMLDGPNCAALQPDGFPLVFTMSGSPGSRSIMVNAEEEHYIAVWHAGDFDLDPAGFYRIAVLASGTELGLIDIQPVAKGGDLRNVNTGEYIGLVASRTLPIRFRIERGAVASIFVQEVIAVLDQTHVLEFEPVVSIAIDEVIAVLDQAHVLEIEPVVSIDVNERITVTDATPVVSQGPG